MNYYDWLEQSGIKEFRKQAAIDVAGAVLGLIVAFGVVVLVWGLL